MKQVLEPQVAYPKWFLYLIYMGTSILSDSKQRTCCSSGHKSDSKIGCFLLQVQIDLSRSSLSKLDQRRMCLLEDLARRLIESLDLPYGLLKRDDHICYCDECKTYSGSAGFTNYNYPVDWYLFRVNVRVPPGTSLEEIFNNWELCFHGTEVPSLKSVLSLGLRIPGDKDLHGRQISELVGHFNEHTGPPGYDTKRIFLSPSIWYAGCDDYARPVCFKSKKSRLTYRVKVALMVRIRPGTYVASSSTTKTFFNPWKYPKDVIEWSTNQRNNVVIIGVLVKFERYQCIGHSEGSCGTF